MKLVRRCCPLPYGRSQPFSHDYSESVASDIMQFMDSSAQTEPHVLPANGRLQATKILPADFTLFHSLDLTNRKLIIGMNVTGVLLLFVFGWLFLGMAALLKPQSFLLELQLLLLMIRLPMVLLIILLVVVLHELSHALFFGLFSRERPHIGFNLLYAYATAPGWYFTRRQFVLIGLAPVLLISLAGVLAMLWASAALTAYLILALTVNAAGAIGDYIVVMWVLGQPATILLRDEGTAVSAYK
ncbi:MAG: DUF3267 domain-containing protein [Ardenticatenaceae bacterium]|nr:DUF3267 domain-containing protein [Ardenticatenaceae bacterium]